MSVLIQRPNIEESYSPELSALTDPHLDPLFSRAERLGAISAWWGHVPFAFWLIKNAEPRVVVELGTHTGVSYSAMCDAVKQYRLPARCFAVDTWAGDKQAGFYDESVYLDFKGFHDERYTHFSTLIRSTFDDALQHFQDGSIDLLHIDGYHTYEAVKHDFDSWRSKLSDRAIVLLHDINERNGDFGAWKVWDEIKRESPVFEFVHSHGLGVVVAGPSAPAELVGLAMTNDTDAAPRIRERFAFIGERWSLEMRERHAHREIAKREQRISEIETRIADLELQKAEPTIAAHAEAERGIRVEAEKLPGDLESIVSKPKRDLEQELAEAAQTLSQLSIAKEKIEAELAAAKSVARAEARRRMAATDELRVTQAKLTVGNDSTAASDSDLARKAVGLAASLEAERARTQEFQKRLAEARLQSDIYPIERCRELANLHAYSDAQLSSLTEKTALLEDKRHEEKRKEVAARACLQSRTAELNDLRTALHQERLVRQAVQVAGKSAQTRAQKPETHGAPRRWTKVAKLAIRLRSLRGARHALQNERFVFEKLIIGASGFFDVDWYCSQYPEVRAAEINPLEHYLHVGHSEDRNPGPNFDGVWYQREYQDVFSSGANPLVHYLEYGAVEGREIRPVAKRPLFALPADIEGVAKLVRQSPLFDIDWYSRNYGVDIGANQDPAVFYVSSANAVYHHPSLMFDSLWYLDRHADVAAAGLNPLVHYLRVGTREGREIKPLLLAEPDFQQWDTEFVRRLKLLADSSLFDAEWYRRQYPDVSQTGANPLVHYLETGALDNRNPGPEFDAVWYLDNYPDVRGAGLNPLIHYLEQGAKEGRRCKAETPTLTSASEAVFDAELERHLKVVSESGLFDADWYREHYPDVATAGANPLLHYVRHGYKEGRNPGPDFDTVWYLERNQDVAKAGLNPLLHYLDWGKKEGRQKRRVAERPTIRTTIANRFPACEPLLSVVVSGTTKRLNLVTDSINSGSLFGGVGTAIILAASLAEHIGAALRIITRTEEAHRQNFTDVLRVNGLEFNRNVDFVHSGPDVKRPVQITEVDLFLTTSWWTTKCMSRTADSRRIAYLLQEDERMFYPFGDDRLRCRETLLDPDIAVAINSELLYKHFISGADPVPNLQSRAVWFEPAFPATHYFLDAKRLDTKRKKKLFFYARPHTTRNLYWRGLEALEAAFEENLFPADEWEIHFAGRSLEKLDLPCGLKLHLHENLPWAEYAALVRQMDLGLCLMDTPHPSYPPLDLAASGAVVVSNKHGSKTSLDGYSANILCCEPTVDGLKSGLVRGALLAEHPAQRLQNYNGSHIGRDWATALAPVVESIGASLLRSIE